MNKNNTILPLLPSSWVWATLGNIILDKKKSIVPNKYPDQIFELYSVPNFAIGKPEIVTGKKIGSSKQVVKEDTVLLCKINPRINRVWIVSSFSSYQKIASTEWIPFAKLDGIEPKYLCYFMQNNNFRDFLALNVSGVGGSLMRIKASTIINYHIPLPPLAEQHRIVTKIEELFTQLDTGLDGLKKIQVQLKHYRQSVLKSACEGRLVPTEAELAWTEGRDYEPADVLLERILEERRRKWEENNKGKKYKEPAAPDTSGLPKLPEGWNWVGIDQISKNIVDCLHSTPKFTEEGKYCVDTNCIEQGKILFDKIRFVSEETYHKRVSRLTPQTNDILFAREGTIGTAVIIPHNIELCLGQRMMMFRVTNGIFSFYFMYALQSRIFEKQWKSKITGSTVPHVNIGDIKLMALPFPSTLEQHRIVAEVERRLSVADKMEKTIDQSLKQAERLRQSILKKAFKGKLVPQDPNDEPAEKLLERIWQKKNKIKESN